MSLRGQRVLRQLRASKLKEEEAQIDIVLNRSGG